MPTLLNQYTLGRTLGSGVSCKVKLAKDASSTRYAIKIMKSDESFQELVQTEVNILTQLHHPNIVRLVEFGTGQQTHPKKGTKTVNYIVLELIGGGELFDFVALGGRLSEAQARHFFRQLLDGLNFMHNQGITHRDLKPENLILDKDFTLKISDMGFAAPIAGRDNSGTLSTQLGTASYMAPEIHLGKNYEGAKVDLFASAIILFVILTQRPPFSSAKPQDPHYRLIAAGRAELFWRAHAEAEEGNDIYSNEFKNLFERLMSLNPAQRPTIAEIMAHPWMQGPVPSTEEIRADFTRRKTAVDAEAHNQRAEKRQQRVQAQNTRQVRRGGDHNQEDGEEIQNNQDAWQNLEVAEYGPCYIQDYTQFFMTSRPLDYFEDLVTYLQKQRIFPRISGSKLCLKFNINAGSTSEESKTEQEIQVRIEVLNVNERKNCVKFSYRDLVNKLDCPRPEAIRHFMSIRDAEDLRMFCDTTFDDESQ